MAKPTNDMVGLTHKAMRTALERMKANGRRMRREFATAPAIPLSDDPDDPIGTERTRSERKAWWDMLMSDQVQMASLVDDQVARYNLPKERPIPRNVVEEALEQTKGRS